LAVLGLVGPAPVTPPRIRVTGAQQFWIFVLGSSQADSGQHLR
jgi:hypothetical protein